MKRNAGSVLGLLVLVAGIAALAFGYYEYQAAQQSIGNVVGKLFTGKSSAETRAIIVMIAGAAAVVLGGFMSFGGRRR